LARWQSGWQSLSAGLGGKVCEWLRAAYRMRLRH
jgi:hypothetical protein